MADMASVGELMTMKWMLGLIGMLVGLLIGGIVIISAYKLAPGAPGGFELAVQVVIVGFLSSVLAAVGFGLGCIIDVVGKRVGKRRDS
jgi:hypothetical protein